MPFFNVSKTGKTLQTIALCQRPDSVCWLCHKPVAVTKIRVITFNQHWPRVMEKSGFFRQHLITSIRKEKRNCRNVHPDLTYGLSPCCWTTFTIKFMFICEIKFIHKDVNVVVMLQEGWTILTVIAKFKREFRNWNKFHFAAESPA